MISEFKIIPNNSKKDVPVPTILKPFSRLLNQNNHEVDNPRVLVTRRPRTGVKGRGESDFSSKKIAPKFANSLSKEIRHFPGDKSIVDGVWGSTKTEPEPAISIFRRSNTTVPLSLSLFLSMMSHCLRPLYIRTSIHHGVLYLNSITLGNATRGCTTSACR